MRNFLILLAACSDPGPASFGDALDDPQLPPRGQDDILTWIEAGHYNDWSCEAAAHPPAPGSGHGPNRICSNDVMVDAADGAAVFPIGAASVKEVFDGAGAIAAFAVYRKIEETTGGDSWYWFEGTRDGNVANGQGDDTCTGCHGGAPRDFVFTIVR